MANVISCGMKQYQQSKQKHPSTNLNVIKRRSHVNVGWHARSAEDELAGGRSSLSVGTTRSAIQVVPGSGAQIRNSPLTCVQWDLVTSLTRHHSLVLNSTRWNYTGCFKTSFTTLKACINVFREHVQCFELSLCSKTHRVLPRIITTQFGFQG
jgi:hypothetical protein